MSNCGPSPPFSPPVSPYNSSLRSWKCFKTAFLRYEATFQAKVAFTPSRPDVRVKQDRPRISSPQSDRCRALPPHPAGTLARRGPVHFKKSFPPPFFLKSSAQLLFRLRGVSPFLRFSSQSQTEATSDAGSHPPFSLSKVYALSRLSRLDQCQTWRAFSAFRRPGVPASLFMASRFFDPLGIKEKPFPQIPLHPSLGVFPMNGTYHLKSPPEDPHPAGQDFFHPLQLSFLRDYRGLPPLLMRMSPVHSHALFYPLPKTFLRCAVRQVIAIAQAQSFLRRPFCFYLFCTDNRPPPILRVSILSPPIIFKMESQLNLSRNEELTSDLSFFSPCGLFPLF